jgi:hypothetical protein
MKKNIVLVGILVFVIVFVILIVVLKSTSDSCSSDCKGKCVDGKCITTPSCVSNCVNNMCKADGCGGICTNGCDGSCVGGECVKSHPGCTPNCSSSDSACKDDGCGGICGGCKGSCVGGKCVIPCTPDCSSPDSAYKDDGCGGKCGGIFDHGQFSLNVRYSMDTVNNSAKDTKYSQEYSTSPLLFTNNKMGGDSSVIGTFIPDPVNNPSNACYVYKNTDGSYKIVIGGSIPQIINGIKLIQDDIYVNDPPIVTIDGGVTHYRRMAIYNANTKFTLPTHYQ